MRTVSIVGLFILFLSPFLHAEDEGRGIETYLKSFPIFEKQEAVQQIMTVSKAETTYISCSLSWDEKYIACRTGKLREKVVKILDVATYKEIAIIRSDRKEGVKHPLYPSSLAWSPDSEHLYIEMRYQVDIEYGEWLAFNVKGKSFTKESQERINFMHSEIVDIEHVIPDPRWNTPLWRFKGNAVEKIYLSPGDSRKGCWGSPDELRRDFPQRVRFGKPGEGCEIFGTIEYVSKTSDARFLGYVFYNNKYQNTIELATQLFPSSTMLRYENGELILYSLWASGGKTNLGKQKYKGCYPGPDRGYFLETEDDKNVNLYYIREVPKVLTEDKK